MHCPSEMCIGGKVACQVVVAITCTYVNLLCKLEYCAMHARLQCSNSLFKARRRNCNLDVRL